MITLLMAAILVFWLGTTGAMLSLVGKIETAGLVGDSFGAVNALFSGAALVGVVIALRLQSQELRLTREEMSRHTVALNGQMKGLTDQVALMHRERNESTFFQLLAYQTQIEERFPRDFQANWSTSLNREYQKATDQRSEAEQNRQPNAEPWDEPTTIGIAADRWPPQNQDLQHYVRHLRGLLDHPVMSDEAFQRYLQAHLKQEELDALFHYGLSKRHGSELKASTERVALFRGALPRQSGGVRITILNEGHLRLYEPAAFGLESRAAFDEQFA